MAGGGAGAGARRQGGGVDGDGHALAEGQAGGGDSEPADEESSVAGEVVEGLCGVQDVVAAGTEVGVLGMEGLAVELSDGVFAVAGEEDPVGFAGGGLELEAVGAFVEEGLVVALDFAGDVPGAEVGGGEEGDGVRLVFASGVECEVGGAVEVLEEELGVAVFGGEVEDDGVFLVALEGSSVL